MRGTLRGCIRASLLLSSKLQTDVSGCFEKLKNLGLVGSFFYWASRRAENAARVKQAAIFCDVHLGESQGLRGWIVGCPVIPERAGGRRSRRSGGIVWVFVHGLFFFVLNYTFNNAIVHSGNRGLAEAQKPRRCYWLALNRFA